MSINILATDESLLLAVESCLRQEQLTIAILKLDQTLFAQGASDRGPFFLIFESQNLIQAGELTKRVRKALGSDRRLFLCMPQPIHPETLLEMGADDIITPASKSCSDIAERILGQVISDRGIHPAEYGPMRGATAAMRRLYEQIERLASFDLEPTLILGATGCGKELVARQLHDRSPRAQKGDLVAVNVAELNPLLVESELFGHKKGAFTGANSDRKGLIETAHGRTILLDEIQELDQTLQAKLLRVLEEKKIRRVGSDAWIEVDVRFAFATNRDLQEECDVGRFKRDFFARIRGFAIEVPPLRERKADIPLLCKHFVDEFSEAYGRTFRIPNGALDCLFRYDWPENVRELRNAIRKAAVFANEREEISPLILQESIRGPKPRPSKNAVDFDPSIHTWRDMLALAHEAYFRALLVAANDRRDVAIRLSGLSKAQFYQKLKEIKLS